jgi:hypothetical protein
MATPERTLANPGTENAKLNKKMASTKLRDPKTKEKKDRLQSGNYSTKI